MGTDMISRARAGDKQAFAQLYAQYKDKLFRYAYFKLGNEQDAQDAVSDCVVEAYLGIAALKSEKAFSRITFKESIPVDSSQYYPKRQARDRQAREDFQNEKLTVPPIDAIYMIDILRQKWTNDDPRL